MMGPGGAHEGDAGRGLPHLERRAVLVGGLQNLKVGAREHLQRKEVGECGGLHTTKKQKPTHLAPTLRSPQQSRAGEGDEQGAHFRVPHLEGVFNRFPRPPHRRLYEAH